MGLWMGKQKIYFIVCENYKRCIFLTNSSFSNAFMDLVKSRASIRWFTPDPVPDEHLRMILEAGIRAPTASGGEQWLFVVVKSEEMRKKVHSFIRKGQMIYLKRMLRQRPEEDELKKWEEKLDAGIYLAPVYIIGLLNYNRRTLKDEYILYEYLWGIESVTLALGNMMLAALSLGYGSVWIAVPKLIEEDFKDALNLPENASYVGMLALGKPAESPGPRRRLPLEKSTLFL